MRKQFLLLVAAVTALSLVAAACGDDDESSGGGGGGTAAGQVTLDARCAEHKGVKAPADFKVSLVTDIGKVDDRTFNQYAYEGMKAAEKCFGLKTTYIETASESDYAKNIETTVAGKPNVVVTVGFLLANDTLAAAQKSSGIKWIGIDQFQATYPDNYVGVLFREDQGGYLAGIKRIIELTNQVEALQSRLSELADELERVRTKPGRDVAIVPKSTALVVWQPRQKR